MKYTIEQLINLKPAGSVLTPIKFSGHRRYKYGTQRLITCKCDCGIINDIVLYSYLKGKTKHCCYTCPLKLNFKHGLSSGNGYHKLYTLWKGIKCRCNNSKRYKEKGIVMCKEWMDDFICFYNWATSNGWYDSNNKSCQIDRINNNGNYEPSNCRFTTPIINARNKDNSIYIEYDNKNLHLNEWAKLLGIHRNTIHRRLNDGWELKYVLSPIKFLHKKKRLSKY